MPQTSATCRCRSLFPPAAVAPPARASFRWRFQQLSRTLLLGGWRRRRHRWWCRCRIKEIEDGDRGGVEHTPRSWRAASHACARYAALPRGRRRRRSVYASLFERHFRWHRRRAHAAASAPLILAPCREVATSAERHVMPRWQRDRAVPLNDSASNSCVSKRTIFKISFFMDLFVK